MFNRLKKQAINLLPSNLLQRKQEDSGSISSFEDLGAPSPPNTNTKRTKTKLRPRHKGPEPLFPGESAPNGAPDDEECAISSCSPSPSLKLLPLPDTSKMKFDTLISEGDGVMEDQYALAKPEEIDENTRIQSLSIITTTTRDGALRIFPRPLQSEQPYDVRQGEWEYVVKDKEWETGEEWDEILRKKRNHEC